ncbi:MAG TPA: hypothetical protein P5549_09735 [Syntrophomonas sp.]|nr:hypothetical protein [Syntrophomonas sp.]
MKSRWTKLWVLGMALLLVGGMAFSAVAADSNNTTTGLLQQGIKAGQQRAQTALKAVVELTGLSADEVRAQRAAGSSLAGIAVDKGISEQTVIDKVAAERTAVLDQLKADNKITADQYNACVTNMQAKIKANIERTGIGPANGGQGQGGAYMRGAGQGQGAGAGQGNGRGMGQGQGMGRGAGANQANCIYNVPAAN